VRYLRDRLDPTRFRGICYFCPASKQWTIHDTQGRTSSRTSSHLQEAECFVVFDDARCRGADLKLRQHALGLLTVAADLKKDQLMQVGGVKEVVVT
jgi:hypothetical protein